MKTALFLAALVALAGVSYVAADLPVLQDYCPEPECDKRCGDVWLNTEGHAEYCGKCNRPGQVHDEECGDSYECPDSSDWMAYACWNAARPCFGAARYALARQCTKAYKITGDSGAVTCLNDATNAETAKLCIRGITDYKIEGWASSQWCAKPSLNRKTQATCMKCLSDAKCNQKWGCTQCLVNSCGDDKKMKACAHAIQKGADTWAAGECIKLSCETQQATCLSCLVAMRKGCLPHYNNNAWFCLNPSMAPAPCYKYDAQY